VKSLTPSATPRVSGAIILDQLEIATEHYGADVVAKAKSTLPVETQEMIAEVMSISWIDSTTVMDLKNAIAHEVGKDPIEFQKWIVRTAVGRTIGKYWRVLLAKLWDGAIVKRAPILYSKTFDVGQLVVVTFDKEHAELLVTGWSHMPEYDAIGLATGMEALLEYSGRHGAHAKFARKGENMGFSLTWRS
jgi:hypothetical protein